MVNVSSSQESQTDSAYLDTSQSIISIKEKNRQAEAWAICAASFEISSLLLKADNPATSTMMNNLANGAKMSIAMTYMTSLLVEENIEPDRFNATWEFAKSAMSSLTEVQSTSIMMSKETQGTDIWFDRLTKTVEFCTSNGESQQMYVDFWRELATSGLLQFEN